MKYRPLGARLLVHPIVTSLSLEERARAAGLEIVVENDNRPSPTMGRVVAVGSDPLLYEEVKLGDIVFFNRYAGHEVVLQNETFRQLEFNEITGVMQDEQHPDTPQVTLEIAQPENDPSKSNSERIEYLESKTGAPVCPKLGDEAQHTRTLTAIKIMRGEK
jgi:co-chaperonin GroES (HSP10)